MEKSAETLRETIEERNRDYVKIDDLLSEEALQTAFQSYCGPTEDADEVEIGYVRQMVIDLIAAAKERG